MISGRGSTTQDEIYPETPICYHRKRRREARGKKKKGTTEVRKEGRPSFCTREPVGYDNAVVKYVSFVRYGDFVIGLPS